MQLKKVDSRIEKELGFPGIYEGKITWDLQTPKTTCKYIGPYFPREEWNKILSFFEWTNETAHSESQVRIYVNAQLNTWKAWAWPQEANTGMTSRELEDQFPPEQLLQFNADEGWLYFGTVHHHCSSTAFQSGTDAANEKWQDGLHITIGKIGQKHYDLHARFLAGGQTLSPDMSVFWDIGDEVIAAVPVDMRDKVAIYQMTLPPIDRAFPDEWKANYKEVKRVDPFPRGGVEVGGSGGHGYPSYITRDNYVHNTDKWRVTDPKRIEWAVESLLEKLILQKEDINNLAALLNYLSKPDVREYIEVLDKYGVMPWQVNSELNRIAKADDEEGEEATSRADRQAALEELKAEQQAEQAALKLAENEGQKKPPTEEEMQEAYLESLKYGGCE